MIDPFNPEDIPDEVLDEITDMDRFEDAYFQHDSGLLYDDDPQDLRCVPRLDQLNVTISLSRKKIKSKSAKADPDYDYNALIFEPEYNTESKKSKRSIPSKNRKDYWIETYSKKPYKTSTKYVGKWLIFVPEKFIDAAWEQIKDATEQGLLGGHSKCSTLFGRKNGPGSDYVICVFTYSWKDEKDVMRVREVLRELGFTKPLPYKSDEDTIAGKYACKGNKKLSKYWE